MITKITKKNVTLDDLLRMTSDEKLAAVDFFVEASSHEAHELWAKWFHYPTKDKVNDPSNQPPLKWEQDMAGFGITIGHIKDDKDLPVNVSFSFAIINGKYICFYEAISRYVDYTMVDEWITKNFPIKYDNGTRFAKTNAANFSNCIWYCRDPK